jgi:hypothetical protein
MEADVPGVKTRPIPSEGLYLANQRAKIPRRLRTTRHDATPLALGHRLCVAHRLRADVENSLVYDENEMFVMLQHMVDRLKQRLGRSFADRLEFRDHMWGTRVGGFHSELHPVYGDDDRVSVF